MNTTVTKVVKGKILHLRDQIPFFQAGGGQPSDKLTAVINEKRFKVKSFSDTTIEVEKPVKFNPPFNLLLKMDIEYRKAVMRAHTCQHLLSALILNEFKIMTKKAVMKDDQATIELENLFPGGHIKHLIPQMNTYIATPEPIISHVLKSTDHHEDVSINLDRIRGSIPKDKEYIRIVQIRDLDLNTCGGTHISSTNEILSFVLIKAKKNILEFYCGIKAINFLSSLNVDLLELGNSIQTQAHTIVPMATKRISELQLKSKNHDSASLKLLKSLFRTIRVEFLVQELLPSSFPILDTKMYYWTMWKSNNMTYALFELEFDRKLITEALQEFTEVESLIILTIIEPFSIQIYVPHPEKSLSAKNVVEKLKEKLNAKGGGSDSVAQIIIPKTDNYKAKIQDILQ